MFVILLLFTGCSCNKPTQPPTDRTVIKGTVVDSLGGQPVAGVGVTLSTGLSVSTDANGRYRLVGMGGGSFTLNHEKYDWRPKSGNVSVEANDSVIVDIKMHPRQWEVIQVPLPSPWAGTWLKDVHFVDEKEGWAVGLNDANDGLGVIIHTIDGGHTWEVQFGDLWYEWYFENVDFVDKLRGWAAAGGPGMKQTVDGGKTWQDIYTPGSNRFFAMDFVDINNGWIVGQMSNGDVFRTSDGGNSWTKIAMLPDSGIADILFNGNNGWASSINKRRIYRTTDGGYTWQVCLEAPNFYYSKIGFTEPCYLWVQGYASRDGGVTWVSQASNTFGSAVAFSFCSPNYGWAVGTKEPYSRGLLINTTDGGTTWEEITLSGTIFSLDAVHFSPEGLGWAVGRGAVVLIYK